MQTKDVQASEEKRAYHRLLRYLVGGELQTAHEEDQAQLLHNKDFLKGMGHHEPSGIH